MVLCDVTLIAWLIKGRIYVIF